VAPTDATANDPEASITDGAGISISTVNEGSGPGAEDGDSVTVHYKAFIDKSSAVGKQGMMFDHADEHHPYMFHLGCGELIEGWEQGCAGLKAGERRIIVVPPSLAWDGAPDVKAATSALGPKSIGGRLRGVGVGGGATYSFEINCMSVEDGSSQEQRDKDAAKNVKLEQPAKRTHRKSQTANWNEKGEYVGPQLETVESLAAVADEDVAPLAAADAEEKPAEALAETAPAAAEPAAAAAAAEDSDDGEVDYDDPMVARASITIQAGFRGMQARKEVEKMRADKYANAEELEEGASEPAAAVDGTDAGDLVVEDMEEDEAGEIEEESDGEVDFDDPMVARASVTIQAGFRGMKARKEVHAMRAEKYGDEESAAAPAAEEAVAAPAAEAEAAAPAADEEEAAAPAPAAEGEAAAPAEEAPAAPAGEAEAEADAEAAAPAAEEAAAEPAAGEAAVAAAPAAEEAAAAAPAVEDATAAPAAEEAAAEPAAEEAVAAEPAAEEVAVAPAPAADEAATAAPAAEEAAAAPAAEEAATAAETAPAAADEEKKEEAAAAPAAAEEEKKEEAAAAPAAAEEEKKEEAAAAPATAEEEKKEEAAAAPAPAAEAEKKEEAAAVPAAKEEEKEEAAAPADPKPAPAADIDAAPAAE